eukprot:gene15629-15775_t
MSPSAPPENWRGQHVDLLFNRLHALKSSGVGIIYISHRLEEIFAHCDRVTVLKDGCHVATSAVADLDRDKLVALMVGREMRDLFPPRRPVADNPKTVLEARNISVPGRVRGASLELKAGTITGMAGMVGSGRTEMALAIFGALPMGGGTVTIDGAEFTKMSPAQAIALGVGLVTEDRKGQGLAMLLDVAANVSASTLPEISTAGLLNTAKEAVIAQEAIDTYQIACRGPSQPVALASNAGLLIVLALLVIMLGIGATLSDRFRSVDNIANVLEQSSGLALVSLGQTMAVLTGGIDLAVGSLMSLLICLTAGLLDGSDTYLYPVLAGILLLGTVIGLINGLGIIVLKIHPLIVTLGMGSILQGIVLLYALGPVGSVPDGFDSLAYGHIGPFPAAALGVIAIYIVVAFLLKSTRFGRYIYAVGDDANAAKLVGLPRSQIILFVYGFSGFFAAVTAIYLTARFGSGQPYAGANYTLASITPVVVGGTLLSGGRGGVMGTLFGTYLVTLLNNLLNFLDVSTYVQLMVQGIIIILAVSVYVENKKGALASFAARHGIYLFLIILLGVCGAVSPSFLQANNLGNLLSQWAPLGIVVVGQTFVILARGLDLSVASVMATAAVAATSFSGTNADALPVLLLALFIGISTGLLNGFLVTKRRVSPFLATLATMIVLQGVRFAWTHGAPSGSVPPIYRILGAGSIGHIPYNIFVLAAVAIVFGGILHFSTFGRKIYITGGNPMTARLVGINADRVTMTCYVISGALAAIAGLVLSGFVGVVDNWVGKGFELNSIVSAVIGGVALSGGRGTLHGALAGTLILVTVFNAVLLFGLPVQFQIIIQGVVIVAASSVYSRQSS